MLNCQQTLSLLNRLHTVLVEWRKHLHATIHRSSFLEAISDSQQWRWRFQIGSRGSFSAGRDYLVGSIDPGWIHSFAFLRQCTSPREQHVSIHSQQREAWRMAFGFRSGTRSLFLQVFRHCCRCMGSILFSFRSFVSCESATSVGGGASEMATIALAEERSNKQSTATMTSISWQSGRRDCLSAWILLDRTFFATVVAAGLLVRSARTFVPFGARRLVPEAPFASCTAQTQPRARHSKHSPGELW